MTIASLTKSFYEWAIFYKGLFTGSPLANTQTGRFAALRRLPVDSDSEFQSNPPNGANTRNGLSLPY